MLSLFPLLLSYSLLAPFLLRLTLAAVFIHRAKTNIRSTGYEKILGIIEVVGSILLVIGLYTQVTALIFGILLAFFISDKIKQRAFLTNGVNYYLILFVLCLVLLVSGAGSFAIDLPL